VKDQNRLLVFALDRNKGHLRPGHGLGDGRGIGGVVLLAALDVGLDPGRRDQPDLMAESPDETRPVMSRRARLHTDQARRQATKERLHLLPAKLPAHDHLSGFINAMNLEDVLGKIETDGDNAHVDGPLVRWESATANLWHLDAGSSGRPHHQLVGTDGDQGTP
jgi:hypothetical protein